MISALVTTIACIAVGYPYAYLMAKAPTKWAAVLGAHRPRPDRREFSGALLRAPDPSVGHRRHQFNADPQRPDRHPIAADQKSGRRDIRHDVGAPAALCLAGIRGHALDRQRSGACRSRSRRVTCAQVSAHLPAVELPGIAAGALLVFVIALGYYIIPAIFGDGRTLYLGEMVVYYTQKLDWGFQQRHLRHPAGRDTRRAGDRIEGRWHSRRVRGRYRVVTTLQAHAPDQIYRRGGVSPSKVVRRAVRRGGGHRAARANRHSDGPEREPAEHHVVSARGLHTQVVYGRIRERRVDSASCRQRRGRVFCPLSVPLCLARVSRSGLQRTEIRGKSILLALGSPAADRAERDDRHRHVSRVGPGLVDRPIHGRRQPEWIAARLRPCGHRAGTALPADRRERQPPDCRPKPGTRCREPWCRSMDDVSADPLSTDPARRLGRICPRISHVLGRSRRSRTDGDTHVLDHSRRPLQRGAPEPNSHGGGPLDDVDHCWACCSSAFWPCSSDVDAAHDAAACGRATTSRSR